MLDCIGLEATLDLLTEQSYMWIAQNGVVISWQRMSSLDLGDKAVPAVSNLYLFALRERARLEERGPASIGLNWILRESCSVFLKGCEQTPDIGQVNALWQNIGPLNLL